MADMAQRRSRIRAATQETHEADAVSVVSVKSSGVSVPEEKRKIISVERFVTDPAFIRVSAGVTKNLDNYEFLRVDIAVTVPCYVEEIDKVQPRVANMVAGMLDEEVEQYMAQGGDSNG